MELIFTEPGNVRIIQHHLSPVTKGRQKLKIQSLLCSKTGSGSLAQDLKQE
jgi:hypothetical protein